MWDGSQPVILQPKDEPYVFNSPVFRLATMEADGYPAFINQSEKVIEHGIHHIITVPSGEAGWPDVTVTARACALRGCALHACALRGCAFHACASRACASRLVLYMRTHVWIELGVPLCSDGWLCYV